MDIDVVIGSKGDKQRIELRHKLRPDTIVTNSPLSAVEAIQKTAAGEPIGSLRIFVAGAGAQFPGSQLARLGGLFKPNGSVEIFTPGPGAAGEGAPTPPLKTAGFGGFGGASTGQSANPAGGFGGFAGASTPNPAGFGGGGFGFNIGFSGAFGGGDLSQNSLHLSGLLRVPVKILEL